MTGLDPSVTVEQAGDVAAALRVLLAADDGDAPLDNASLAEALGWDLPRTSACLEIAKEHSMIWGQRGSRQPAPWFAEIEVTMQGRRFLRSFD